MNEGTVTICFPTLKTPVSWPPVNHKSRYCAPDVSLPNKSPRVVNALCQTTLKDLCLQSSLQEILYLEGQHVIETHAGFVEHTDPHQAANDGVTLEETLGILGVKLEKLSGSTTDFGEGEGNTPDFALVAKAVLTSEL
jgi:hypothetical protein